MKKVSRILEPLDPREMRAVIFFLLIFHWFLSNLRILVGCHNTAHGFSQHNFRLFPIDARWVFTSEWNIALEISSFHNWVFPNITEGAEVTNLYQGNLIFICWQNTAMKLLFYSENKQGSRTIIDIKSASGFKSTIFNTASSRVLTLFLKADAPRVNQTW